MRREYYRDGQPNHWDDWDDDEPFVHSTMKKNREDVKRTIRLCTATNRWIWI